MSDEHKKYLKLLKKEKITVSFFRISIILLFIILWEIFSKYKIINTFLYSSPSKVINTIIELINNGNLFKHISTTVYEVLISFFISTILGIIIASIMWSSKIFSKIIDPYLTIINSLPKVALGPLIIIWVGASTNSIIFMALTITVFTTIINLYNGFNSVDSKYIVMLKSFGASRLQTFGKIILPCNLKNIIATLKINVSLSLIGVIMGELLVSKEGLGYLIMYGSQVFNLDLVISSIFILGIISCLMYYIIDFLEKKLVKY